MHHRRAARVQVIHALCDLHGEAHRLAARELVGAAVELLEEGALAPLHHDAAPGRHQVRRDQLDRARALERRMHEELGLDGSEGVFAHVVQRLDGDGATAVEAGVHRAHRAGRELLAHVKLIERDQRPGVLLERRHQALVTLLSGLASLVSVFESLISIFGRWLVVVMPVAAVGLATCPPQQRRKLAIALCMLLCSGFLF